MATKIDKDETVENGLVLTTMSVTSELAGKLRRHYGKMKVTTHHGGGRNGANFTYTVSYAIKTYRSGKCLITSQGAEGYVSKYDEKKLELLKNPRRPLLDLYFYLYDRFPNHILSTSGYNKNDLENDDAENIPF